MAKNKLRVSLKEYAERHNPKLNRRGHKMSQSYLYRLIRENEEGKRTGDKSLWFEYIMEGDKDHIYILL